MIIQSGRVSMASSHSYEEYLYQKTESLSLPAAKAADVILSEEGKSLVEQMKDYKESLKEQAADAREKNMQQNLLSWGEMMRLQKQEAGPVSWGDAMGDFEVKLELMEKMLEALRGKMGKHGKHNFKFHAPIGYGQNIHPTGSSQVNLSMGVSSSQSASITIGGQIGGQSGNVKGGQAAGNAVAAAGANGSGTTWTKITAASVFYAETESTQYQAQGSVKTADGRTIDFGVTVEMSRGFCAKYDSLTKEDYIKTDPLVINLDGNVTQVSDQKFLFDLDTDGKKEEISFVEKGSGFLALDKNNDHKINDGNELFGTKSGNGFADLAAYDEDKNGWIDEADDVFSDLRIWTKDKDGNDKLLTLKEAGVGALHLGYAQTQFSLNNMETNKTNAEIKSTGIFLRENGTAGTLQHVDMVI